MMTIIVLVRPVRIATPQEVERLLREFARRRNDTLLARVKREARSYPRHACGRYCTHPEFPGSVEGCKHATCPFGPQSDVTELYFPAGAWEASKR